MKQSRAVVKLTRAQHAWLTAGAKRAGVGFSEYLRRVLDEASRPDPYAFIRRAAGHAPSEPLPADVQESPAWADDVPVGAALRTADDRLRTVSRAYVVAWLKGNAHKGELHRTTGALASFQDRVAEAVASWRESDVRAELASGEVPPTGSFEYPKCPDCGVTVAMYGSTGVHGEPLCAAWGAVAVRELDAAAYARVYGRG